MNVSEMGWLSQVRSPLSPCGKGAQELDDALEVEQQQRQDGAGLDHDGVHLPVGVVERNLHHRFGDAQMRRGADRQEFGQAFNNAQHDGLNVDVQKASGMQP